MEFKRRCGEGPHPESIGPNNSSGAASCPDVWELESGDFAVIGIRTTGSLAAKLPVGAGCGPDEEIVIVPRRIMLSAAGDMPHITHET